MGPQGTAQQGRLSWTLPPLHPGGSQPLSLPTATLCCMEPDLPGRPEPAPLPSFLHPVLCPVLHPVPQAKAALIG